MQKITAALCIITVLGVSGAWLVRERGLASDDGRT